MAKFDLSFVQGLKLAEKAALVSGKNFWFTAGNADKNIPKIMVTDGPSGLRKQADDADALGLNQSVQAISFPSSALTASSFNTNMLYQLGQHLGEAAKAEQVSVLLGPGVNIKRSPLAGRNFEYFSEDPYLSGEMGAAYVNGVQQQGVGVSVKHFAANNRESQRFTSSSNIDERTLREVYLAAFEKIVKTSQPATLMCSYNAINGVLSSQNYRLLTQILRHEWGFTGLVMSDWGAVADNIAALKAGLDLEMPGNGDYSVKQIIAAVKSGELEESVLDTAVLRVLQLVEKYHIETTSGEYDKEEQHAFARQMAADSMVLLKNEQQVLPLKATDKVAIIGELAQKPRYQGGGSSHVNPYKLVTPLAAAQASQQDINYAAGYHIDQSQADEQLVASALIAAKASDKVVVFAGVPERDESEGFDKTTIDLPENQTDLINQLATVNKNIIVVLQNGSAITMPWQDKVAGIVETYLAGEAVGEATWDILTGAVNPSGKLAETFPIRLSDTPTYGTFAVSRREENYHEGIFVGYRYYDVKDRDVNYPFGHGLSYTSFKYDDLVIDSDSQKVQVTFNVTNTGDLAGQEAVQLYVNNLASDVETPVNALQAFEKVTLAPGETKQIQLVLGRRQFAWYDVKRQAWTVDNGDYVINIGSSSRDIRLSQHVAVKLGANISQPITSETYISEVINRTDLRPAIEESGLSESLDMIANVEDNQELLANMPMRAVVMLGADIEQLNKFLALVNK
jgi:beta-glucosidase